MTIQTINGSVLRECILNGAVMLKKNKKHIDSLNVFPVPDGDTGTNMMLTLTSAVNEIEQNPNASVSDIAKSLAHGSLKGARGNSGVILSQLYRGFFKSVEGKETIDAKELAIAAQEAVATAYKAVMKPREGTILTVARFMADEAVAVSRTTDDILAVVQAVMKKGWETLERTPDMLPVLKQAGVVDSGGKGLLLFCEGMMLSLKGDPALEWDESSEEQTSPAERVPEFTGITESEIEFGYCNEFFITDMKTPVANEVVDQLKNRLSTIGDSIVVVADPDLIKVHVHSNDPDKVLGYALQIGQLSSIKIENMREQHSSIIAEAQLELERERPLEEYAMVTIAIGDGIKNVFSDLGIRGFVDGGQTMNPSTDDIVNAIQRAHSKTVFVFPNNSNIIMAARQAIELVDCDVRVIPTTSIPQGISAAIAFDPMVTADENEASMIAAIEQVKTGQVTYSVRDTQLNGHDIKTGDIVGIGNGTILAAGSDINTVTFQMLEQMVDETTEIITLFYGMDVKQEDSEALLAQVSEKFSQCDVDCLAGGQPVYYYIASVE